MSNVSIQHLPTELVRRVVQIIQDDSGSIESSKKFIRLSAISHLFLAISREIWLDKTVIWLNCTSDHAQQFLEILESRYHSFLRPLHLHIHCTPRRPNQAVLKSFFRRIGQISPRIGRLVIAFDRISLRNARNFIPVLTNVAGPDLRQIALVRFKGSENQFPFWFEKLQRSKRLEEIEIRYRYNARDWDPRTPMYDPGPLQGQGPSTIKRVVMSNAFEGNLLSRLLDWLQKGNAELSAISVLNVPGYRLREESGLQNALEHAVCANLEELHFQGSTLRMPLDLSHLTCLGKLALEVGLSVPQGDDSLLRIIKTLNFLMHGRRLGSDAPLDVGVVPLNINLTMFGTSVSQSSSPTSGHLQAFDQCLANFESFSHTGRVIIFLIGCSAEIPLSFLKQWLPVTSKAMMVKTVQTSYDEERLPRVSVELVSRRQGAKAR